MTYTSQYPPEHTWVYVKSTTYLDSGGNYITYLATDPSKSLTGSWTGNGWLTATGRDDNNRFHIDLGEAKVIKRIYYENVHNSGANTDCGSKNFTFWGSNNATAFANLTYTTDTDWTQLTTDISTFAIHASANSVDPKYVVVTNTTAYRYYAVKIAASWGSTNYSGFRRIELQTEDPTNGWGGTWGG